MGFQDAVHQSVNQSINHKRLSPKAANLGIYLGKIGGRWTGTYEVRDKWATSCRPPRPKLMHSVWPQLRTVNLQCLLAFMTSIGGTGSIRDLGLVLIGDWASLHWSYLHTCVCIGILRKKTLPPLRVPH